MCNVIIAIVACMELYSFHLICSLLLIEDEQKQLCTLTFILPGYVRI